MLKRMENVSQNAYGCIIFLINGPNNRAEDGEIPPGASQMSFASLQPISFNIKFWINITEEQIESKSYGDNVVIRITPRSSPEFKHNVEILVDKHNTMVAEQRNGVVPVSNEITWIQS